MNHLDDPVVREVGQPSALEEADEGQQEADEEGCQGQAEAATAQALQDAQRPERKDGQDAGDDVDNLQRVGVAGPEYNTCDEIEQDCDAQYHDRNTCHERNTSKFSIRCCCQARPDRNYCYI